MNMAEQNPDLLNQHLQKPPQTQQPEETKTQAAPQVPPAMPENYQEMMNNPMMKEMMNNPEMIKQAMAMMGGNADPSKMQDMMKNPSMKNLLSNPEMLQQSIQMMKSNPAMLEMLQKQIPGVDPATLTKGLEWLASIAGYYAKTRNFFGNKSVQLVFILLLIAWAFWYFG